MAATFAPAHRPPPTDMASEVPSPPDLEIDAAVLEGIKQFRMRKRTCKSPAAGEVQLKINCVGVCGSDMAYWAKGVAGGFLEIDFSEKALCEGFCGQMGHESAGTVVALGRGVTHLQVGDRVALEPGIPCGTCKHCRLGRYNLCESLTFIGSAVNRTPGALCTRFNHQANFCYKLPSHVSLAEGAMLEPLCVSLQAMKRSGIRIGQRVLVSGAGPIGLMTALCARSAGALSVTILDMADSRLAKAKEIGIEHTVRADTPNIVDHLEQIAGDKFDVCFECCGVPSSLNTCVDAAALGGSVCIVANFSGQTQLNLQLANRKELDIHGVWRYCNLYPTALDMVANGKIDLKPLISKTFSLAEVNEAFEYFASGEPIKVIIQPNDPEAVD